MCFFEVGNYGSHVESTVITAFVDSSVGVLADHVLVGTGKHGRWTGTETETETEPGFVGQGS